MITKKQLIQLVDFKGDGDSVISLYLALKPEMLKNRGFVSEAKNLLKKVTGDPALEKEHSKIINFLETKFDPSSRSIAIFSSAKDNFFQFYEIPVPVKSACIVEREPYIKPLVRLLEQYETYCLVLVDGKKARLFSIYMERLDEHTSILDDVPGWHKQGGWSQARFQRHIKYHVYEHFKRVADVTLSFFKREHFDRLILGGPHEVVTHFKNILHIYLARRLVGEISIETNAGMQEVKKKVLSLIKKIEEEENKGLMKRIDDNLGKMAVAGIDSVLDMLNQGRIQVLVLDSEFTNKGWICPKCYRLSTRLKKCDACGKDMESVEDIIEKIVEENFELSGETHFLANNEKIKELGGIAAILRW